MGTSSKSSQPKRRDPIPGQQSYLANECAECHTFHPASATVLRGNRVLCLPCAKAELATAKRKASRKALQAAPDMLGESWPVGPLPRGDSDYSE